MAGVQRRYTPDDKEKRYLRKYLLLSVLLARKMAEEGITEENMMNYYQTHKYDAVKTEIRNKLISGSSLPAWLNETGKSIDKIK